MSGEGSGLFRSRVLVALIVLSGVATIAAVLLLAFGSRFLEPSSAGPNSYSFSAIGFRGAYTALRADGLDVRRVRDPRLPGVRKGVALVVAGPPTGDDRYDAADALKTLLHEARRRGAVPVVVLPKWAGSPSPVHIGWIAGASRRSDGAVEKIAAAALGKAAGDRPFWRMASNLAGKAESSWGERYGFALDGPQLLSSVEKYEPLVSTGDGLLVARVTPADGGPPVVVVSDPDLFDNQGLGHADHAALLLDLITKGIGANAVAFDETLHGFGESGGLLADALSFPAVLVTLHVLLVLGLATWAGSVRLGPARPDRPARALGREAFIDSTARLLVGAPDEIHALATYWRAAQDAVAEAMRLPPLAPAARLRRLAALTEARGVAEDVVSLDAEIAASVRVVAKPASWLSLAERAYRWRRSMTVGLRPVA